MEGLTLFSIIIVTVFGVLQLILFFKLWGMTNNVKKIKLEILNDARSLNAACVSYLKGEIDKTETLLNEAFIQEAAQCYKQAESFEDFNNEYFKLKTKYSQLFQKIDRPSPDFDKYAQKDFYLI